MTNSAQRRAGAFEDTTVDGTIIRRVATTEEYDACVRMQHAIWGEDFTEIVPTTMLRVTQRIGGVTAGAFDGAGRLLGFVFGMLGVLDGRMVHWSDMLAVHPEARNRGLGRRLKFFQRELLLPLGVHTMYWTYDPLVAKNAYLNLVRLGARPADYVVNMYGSDTQSAIDGGIGTDRFVVAWDLLAEHGAHRPATSSPPADDENSRDSPIVNNLASTGDRAASSGETLPDDPVVRVEVPTDIQQVIVADLNAAMHLRETTRRIFTHYMGRGYRVTAFSHRMPEDRFFYILSRNHAS